MMTYKQLMVMTMLCAHVALLTGARAEATNKGNASVQRIGVYDSRAVAYAHFWTAEHQQWLKEKMNMAKAAKAGGDAAQCAKLSKELADDQQRIHREVFSTAPAEEAMAALKPRLAQIQKEAGLSALVSKWDKQTIESYKTMQQVDVTDLLVREFKLEAKQIKTIEEIKKQTPVPLDEIDNMHDD